MAIARNTDPQTSHAAAASVRNVTATQTAILNLFSKQLGLSDSELIDIYFAWVDAGFAPMASPSGIRSRRAELVVRGLLADSGEREKTPSGRSSVIWSITADGRAALNG
jgi:hypothetical protein